MEAINILVSQETTQAIANVVNIVNYFDNNDPNEYFLEDQDAVFYPIIEALKLKAGQEIFDNISK